MKELHSHISNKPFVIEESKIDQGYCVDNEHGVSLGLITTHCSKVTTVSKFTPKSEKLEVKKNQTLLLLKQCVNWRSNRMILNQIKI